MKNKFKKGQTVRTVKDMNLTKTGGPFIPKGSVGEVLMVHRDGRIGVDLPLAGGKRHLYPEDIEEINISFLN